LSIALFAFRTHRTPTHRRRQRACYGVGEAIADFQERLL